MSNIKILEVTITHNLDCDAKTPEDKLKQLEKTQQLFEKQLIALDWGLKGSFERKEYESIYQPDRKIKPALLQYDLFAEMKEKGAAVIAAYKGAVFDGKVIKPSDRLIGWVEKGAKFQNFNELLCLPLTNVRRVDSSRGFLGNLPPRQCTLQRCSNRARGRLADLVLGRKLPRDVWQLHNQDVEVLVTNYLIAKLKCKCVWKGAQSFENIDHIGFKDGREIIAQTTVSEGFVKEKAEKLIEYQSEDRDLYFFGPKSSREQCSAGINYQAIEDVFTEIDQLPEGQWLIDRMLSPQFT